MVTYVISLCAIILQRLWLHQQTLWIKGKIHQTNASHTYQYASSLGLEEALTEARWSPPELKVHLQLYVDFVCSTAEVFVGFKKALIFGGLAISISF